MMYCTVFLRFWFRVSALCHDIKVGPSFHMTTDCSFLPHQVTAVFGRPAQVVHHPVTFKSRAGYVALPQLKAYSSTNVYFQFKTLQPSGLLMYNGGKGEKCSMVFDHLPIDSTVYFN